MCFSFHWRKTIAFDFNSQYFPCFLAGNKLYTKEINWLIAILVCVCFQIAAMTSTGHGTQFWYQAEMLHCGSSWFTGS